MAMLCVTTSVLTAQTAGWRQHDWGFPQVFPDTSPVFEPVEVFPRMGPDPDPGQPPNGCPTLRPTGIRGFRYDAGTPNDPNDDREYMVVGRSDGILIADATPSRDANPGANPPLPPFPSRKVLFQGEPDPLLLPLGGWPLNPDEPVTLATLLNGLPNGAHLDGIPYCPPGSNHTWKSTDTTNREVAVFHAGAYWYVYSVNTLRAGLWVLRLKPNPDGLGELIVDPAFGVSGGGLWLVPNYGAPAGPLGACHNLDVDRNAGREALYLTDDSHGRVVQLDLSDPAAPGSLYARTVADNYPFHDAMVKGSQLFVSAVVGEAAEGPATTMIFQLPPIAVGPPTLWTQIESATTSDGDVPMGHSVYVDNETPFAPPRLYTLREDAGQPATKRNYAIFSIDANDDTTTPTRLQAVVTYVFPTDVPPLGNPPSHVSPVHNLRGLRRTGFVAQYREGLGLLDLFNDEPTALDSGALGFVSTATIASFDTTSRMDGTPVPPSSYPTTQPAGSPTPYATKAHWRGDPAAIASIADPLVRSVYQEGWSWLDKFLGSWDVEVSQDSGLVYSPLGPVGIPGSATGQERLLTAGVFRVHQGHLNRYWDSTPFPAASPNAESGRVPRLVVLQSMPRANHGFLIGDENAGKYAATDAQGRVLEYEYTLIASPYDPVGVGSMNPATAAVPLMWDPDPTPGSVNNDIWLNVWDPSQPIATKWIRRQGPDLPTNPSAGWFFFPSVGDQGQRWYVQLIVQEYMIDPLRPARPTKTGRFAASRGHWFGVARG